MISLPIDAWTGQIVRLLKDAAAIVIVAEPGAGKTTRVPPAILRAGLLSAEHSNLVMLQPRRVAARAAAQRIAEENNWQVGREVGYQIRFEKRVGPDTRLRVLTEGVLTRQLLSDPFLASVGAVVLDEFHERSLHTDLAVGMLREMSAARPDMKIIVMSATLQAQTVSKFLGDCPIVNVPGRLFPVEIEYRPHGHVPIIDRVATAAEDLLANSKDTGDVLVFLPGAEEIRRVQRRLQPVAEKLDLALLPLHGSLPIEEQTLALQPSAKRKIILATNIAETSLTIDGVTTVIDSGLARIPAFDPRRGLDRLELARISKASANQRAGRAGRTAPGRCIRLWSAKEQAALDDFDLPEVGRVDLCPAVLDLHAWGNPKSFAWIEPPPPASLESAEKLLQMLGALDDGKLTPLGRKLMKLPVHPRVGRLLCAAADEGCPVEGAGLAALLSEKDILRSNPADRRASIQSDSDLLIRLEYLSHGRGNVNVDTVALRQAKQARDTLEKLAVRLTKTQQTLPSQETLLKLVLWAYPDRVCRRREFDPATASMVGGGAAALALESAVRKPEFFLALDARHDSRSQSHQALVRIASAIHPEWLKEMFPDAITRQKQAVFDEQRQAVVGTVVERYLDLILSEARDAAVDAQEASRVLAAALRPRAAAIFNENEPAANLLARIDFLRRSMPEHPWPNFDENQLGDLLAELCHGKRSLEQVQRAGMAHVLESQLQYPLDRLLAQHAPESLPVPSGNEIRLNYSLGQSPVLAVRLQEIFGWTDTPRIAGGRVAVLLHLLGPNYRVVQITDDLRSFWSNAYFQVRKDLRVRYPKHSWPDDPTTAAPQAKGGKRRR